MRLAKFQNLVDRVALREIDGNRANRGGQLQPFGDIVDDVDF